MLAKVSCEHCGGHLEIDVQYAGMSVKCPHCFQITKLVVSETAPVTHPPVERNTFGNHVAGGEWENEPMSDKQRAMLQLHGVSFSDSLTKGEAARMIDSALQRAEKPTLQNQAKAGEMFVKARLSEVIDAINAASGVIGDETAPISALKQTKKNVKETVKTLTDIIDKRIEAMQNSNREARYERDSEWLRQRGL